MKRIPIVIFLTALIVSLFLLFDKCSSDQPLKLDITQIIKSEKQISAIDTYYQKIIFCLQMHSDSLQKELFEIQLKLKIVKLKLEQSKFDVVKLVKKDTTKLSIQQKLNDCDSLKEEVSEYVFWVDSIQRIYENSITQRDSLLAVKDSEIVIRNTTYLQLRNITAENLKREQKLTDDLNTAYKRQRKNRIQNKVLSATCLILSGITTTLFINSRK